MFNFLAAVLLAHLQMAAGAPVVTVAVRDDAGVPLDWMQQAKEELAAIFRGIGVAIVWWEEPDRPQSGGAVPRNLLTLAIRNNAVSLQDEPAENTAGIASGTAVERGRVAYVFYDQTEQFRPLVRGRLLGHVMAHELGHLLLPAYSHSSRGLMRAQWNRDDLERAEHRALRFTPEQGALIRSRATALAAEVIDAPR